MCRNFLIFFCKKFSKCIKDKWSDFFHFQLTNENPKCYTKLNSFIKILHTGVQLLTPPPDEILLFKNLVIRNFRITASR